MKEGKNKKMRPKNATGPDFEYENTLLDQGYKTIAGVDEAGRGPWAGPIIAAAAVINIKNSRGFTRGRQKFPRVYSGQAKIKELGIKDSKKLTPKKREEIYNIITKDFKTLDVNWAIGRVSAAELNKIGLAQAGKLVLKRAVENLKTKPDYLLIDAFRIPGLNIPQSPIIKGDDKSISIALASIIAKVTRDKIMTELDKKYPEYRFARHKGYGTKEHLGALKKYGICPEHRVNYKPIGRIIDSRH